MQVYLKREKALDDELLEFMKSHERMEVRSRCDLVTKNVRDHIKKQALISDRIEREYSEIGDGFLEDDDMGDLPSVSEGKSELIINRMDDEDLFNTLNDGDEIFSMRDLVQIAMSERQKRSEFQENLLDSVRGIRGLT